MPSLIQKHAHVKGQRSNNHIFKFQPNTSWAKKRPNRYTSFRRALTRFRISAHSQAIETGRHHNIERSNRKCIYCYMNVIESEFHFMLICPLYAELRSKYLNRYYCRWPTVHKFHKLMNKQSKHSLQIISQYIYFAFR